MKSHYCHDNRCLDCGKLITDAASRCKRCAKAGVYVGASNSHWNGGVTRDPEGYMRQYQLEHPHANSRGYVFVHRLVIEKSVGRYLTRKEEVHHLNGDKADNRLENLVALTHAEHMGLHYLMRREGHV